MDDILCRLDEMHNRFLDMCNCYNVCCCTELDNQRKCFTANIVLIPFLEVERGC
jgi:hypothetical protein